jgi:hypothetical protein
MKQGVRFVLQLFKGLVSFIYPYKLLSRKGTGGNTDSARYCYEIWFRHLYKIHASGNSLDFETIAELGPGSSLGIGICALLSGTKTYYAMDLVNHLAAEKNILLLEELLVLFRNKTTLDNNQYRWLNPNDIDENFPLQILDDKFIIENLNPERVKKIKFAIQNFNDDPAKCEFIFSYIAPWESEWENYKNKIDLVISQFVLEHVDRLDNAYLAMHAMMKDKALMSHLVDFWSHNSTPKWNSHWKYSRLLWKLIRGKRPFYINRTYAEIHTDFCIKNNFTIVNFTRYTDENSISRDQLAIALKQISDADLVTKQVYILCRK